MTMDSTTRLRAEDFIALRSLGKSRWMQGLEVMWRFNRTWYAVPFSRTARAAADRLIGFGLAEEGECDCGCKRSVVQLTAKGVWFAKRIGASGEFVTAFSGRIVPALKRSVA